ncbi:MAG: phosphoribosylglycinamide formyltransferase [Bacteroidetes bacterium]|nr:MAG: phosphoribosylglycinamide formyltransferase [Bacteroidota bacterium]TAG93288.1 MAG: phosphoribosylglycinamide formyltransferase [Bacteroidota bacterium]
MINWAIFASGNGSNAEAIIQKFEKRVCSTEIKLVLCNKADAYILERVKKYPEIKAVVFDKKDLYERETIRDLLRDNDIYCIALAGFNWILPENIVNVMPKKRILNLHPSLLPKYGGKGMYGNKVHEAVLLNKEKQSGITIHYVNEKYDEGEIIEQIKCEVLENDTVETLSTRIHALEHEHYPRIIDERSETLAMNSIFSNVDSFDFYHRFK